VAEVRRATPADFPALIAMGRALHDESPRYRDMPFNPDKLLALAGRLQGSLLYADAVILVATAGGEPVGMTVGVVAERFFNDERYVTDLTVYVKPEHRGGSAFLRMIRALEAWAADQGVADLAIGVSTEIHADRTVCAYEKLGYRLAGYTMVKRNVH
jgi:GNAT superfamily N-acetyltransferase